MIKEINKLQSLTQNVKVKAILENASNTLSSLIYKNVSDEAKQEIENVTIKELFSQLNSHKYLKEVNEWLESQKRLYTIRNIGVNNSISNLMISEGKVNPMLSIVLEKYKNLLSENSEISLYESYVENLQPFSYIPAVQKEIKAILETVEPHKSEISIVKILDKMKTSRSFYLVPLIEDEIHFYVKNKNDQTKSHLKETLVKFSYDENVREIINTLMLDDSKLQLEYKNAAFHIDENICSPIIYLGENEVLFNVKGEFYIRKGNNINRVKRENLNKIDENYISLCNTLNDENVIISKNKISIYGKNDKAIINENEVIVNNINVNQRQLSESYKMALVTADKDFYEKVLTISQNYDNIAEIDFVKRVSLKENSQFYADIFKLRDNIYITTNDPHLNKITFYRNINPIQAEKIMKEHMQFDISSLTKNILPAKDKIINHINETKSEYNAYINELNENINKFQQKTDEVSLEILNLLKEELDATQNDYREYCLKSDRFLNISENLNITVQDDNTGKSYTVVVPTGTMAPKKANIMSGDDTYGLTDLNVQSDSNQYGTEVGVNNIQSPSSSSSAITFNSNDSEMLSDSPSDEKSNVDLDADEIEAYADKVDAEKELEPKEDENEMSLDDESGNADTDTDANANADANDKKEISLDDLSVSDEESTDSENKPEEKEVDGSQEEGIGAPSKDLEKDLKNKDKNPNDLDKPKKIKKVFLKKPKK